jgi:hypothetical protein
MNSVLDTKGNPGKETEKHEEAAAVRKALTTLPDQVRIIVVMRHFEDLKFREIAEALHLPEGTVKTRIIQGLSLLAKQLRTINDPDSASDCSISRKTHLSSTLLNISQVKTGLAISTVNFLQKKSRNGYLISKTAATVALS